MRRLSLLLLACFLAGCSGGGGGTVTQTCDKVDASVRVLLTTPVMDCFDVDATATTGILVGVVVDQAIRPLSGAEVSIRLPDGGAANRTTDDTGRFAFDGLEPGTYLVEAKHLLHKSAQTSAEVVAGDDDPKVLRVMLERLFSQEPYSVPLHHEGFIQCGYDITVASSLCLNDYTHFVGPYTCTDCEHILDRRSADFAVEAGWQTMVFEMDWEPTTQATSVEMSLTISHFPRPASHWYCQGSGAHPVLVRMEVNVTCDNQQSEPEQVPPEGLPNMHMFGASNAQQGTPASATFGQKFDVYTHIFYYGNPPEGWSFIAGDEPPF